MNQRIVISETGKHPRKDKVTGRLQKFEQVVYKTPAGTRTNGKPAFKSVTRHEVK